MQDFTEQLHEHLQNEVMPVNLSERLKTLLMLNEAYLNDKSNSLPMLLCLDNCKATLDFISMKPQRGILSAYEDFLATKR